MKARKTSVRRVSDRARAIDTGHFEGSAALRGVGFGWQNVANLRTGSGMQQARGALTEKAVEAVRNRMDGT